MDRSIYFDLDGTLADLYAVEGWLPDLRSEKTRPYREAKPLVNMRQLAKALNNLQKSGYHIGVISWGSKVSSDDYLARVAKTKQDWLKKHLGSVHFDEIKIVHYGTPKASVCDFPAGILFDDEEKNRNDWTGTAYNVQNILDILHNLEKGA